MTASEKQLQKSKKIKFHILLSLEKLDKQLQYRYLTGADDLFVLKKELRDSDVNHRLVLDKAAVENLILPQMEYYDEEVVDKIKSGESLVMIVSDEDTNSYHELKFGRRGRTKGKSKDDYYCYVFDEGWMEEFVKRRELEEGDTIGLYWNSYSGYFSFSVLKHCFFKPKYFR